MKAATYTSYGPPSVLTVTEIDRPAPNANEVLIKVYATTVNRTDCGYRSAQYVISRLFTGLLRPKRVVWGSEFAGKVVEIGANVQSFKVGDKVFGFDDVNGRAHAEYMTASEDSPIAHMPTGCSYQNAAPAGEGATYALNVIESVNIQNGQKVLVYGASGAIGSAAVQILKHLGANVTAVCGTKNLKLAKSLGATRVIDYQTEDFRSIDEMYDFIFDAVGKSSYGVCKKLLKKHGTYYSTELGKGGQNPLLAVWFAFTGSRKVIFPIPKINQEKIEYIKELMEIMAYKPVIDRIVPLESIVEAAEYVESGQKTGNVVISL